VALVTGAASGIGRATAVLLAKEGARVVVADVDDEGSAETIGLIKSLGGEAFSFHADVTDPEQCRAMVAAAEQAYGGLDILHNNAGIITMRPRYPDAELERWMKTFVLNLQAVILGTQVGIEAMSRRGGGVIVQSASIAGLIPYPTDPIYGATKAGVVNFTRSLAPLREERNIRVNCVCPGVVDTPMVTRARQQAPDGAPTMQLGALIAPEHVADAVVMLVRDESLAGKAVLVRAGQPHKIVEAAALA